MLPEAFMNPQKGPGTAITASALPHVAPEAGATFVILLLFQATLEGSDKPQSMSIFHAALFLPLVKLRYRHRGGLKAIALPQKQDCLTAQHSGRGDGIRPFVNNRRKG
jgi:hypothetical protein